MSFEIRQKNIRVKRFFFAVIHRICVIRVPLSDWSNQSMPIDYISVNERCHRHQTLVASHSYGWNNGNKHQSPCHRYGINNNNGKYNIRYLTASMVILTTLHTSHRNSWLTMFDASGISDWNKNTICIKWQTTNIECLWHHKAEEQKTIFDNGHIRNRTWKDNRREVRRAEWLRATLNCFRRNTYVILFAPFSCKDLFCKYWCPIIFFHNISLLEQ